MSFGGWKFLVTGLIMLVGIGLSLDRRCDRLEMIVFEVPLNHLLLYRLMTVMAISLVLAGAMTIR